MTIQAPAVWPRMLNETMVRNGSTCQALHGTAIEQAIHHLCGFGYAHSSCVPFDSVNGPKTLAPADTLRLRVYLSPYARDVEVWLLLDATLDETSTLEVSMGGSAVFTKTIMGIGASEPNELVWSQFILYGVDAGNATADGEQVLLLENVHATHDLFIFAVAIKQVPNLQLEV